MSASLVGSEMCIRDSSRVGFSAEPAGRARVSGVRPAVRAGRCFVVCFEPCLLYTSDAADDM
eukprot:5704973-Alexandrium_andersonii.AAC.1